MGITETWFTDISPISMYKLPCLDLITNSRSVKSGGGVALYIPLMFRHQYLSELSIMKADIEALFVEIVEMGWKNNLIVGVVYRPPKGNIYNFMNELNSLLSNQLLKGKHLILMGDFNIDLLKVDQNSKVNEFIDLCTSFSVLPLITKPTRVENSSATLIDNMFSNIQPFSESGIIVTDVSDHFLVFTELLRYTGQKDAPLIQRKFVYNERNLSIFRERLAMGKWDSVFCTEDIETSYNNFLNTFKALHDDFFQMKVVKPRKSKKSARKSWINKHLLKRINKKCRLYCKWKKDGTNSSKIAYVKFKNKLTIALRYAKKNYFLNKFKEVTNDCKATWKVIKNILNSDIKSKSSEIKEINFNGKLIQDFREISHIFNNYFAKSGTDLAEAIPSTSILPGKFMGDPNPRSMFIFPVTEAQVYNIIRKLKSKKSPVFDDVSNDLLKNIFFEIATPLTYLFNLSLSTGTVPS
ncbi:uncharacterized protein LOC117116632, partial [Anneissia japonica]|uniref:uncharacterized protein LOC117116632 n=1 Tax=Anneissia japonica TaxID=1529436 RepID=UPI0014257396